MVFETETELVAFDVKNLRWAYIKEYEDFFQLHFIINDEYCSLDFTTLEEARQVLCRIKEKEPNFIAIQGCGEDGDKPLFMFRKQDVEFIQSYPEVVNNNGKEEIVGNNYFVCFDNFKAQVSCIPVEILDLLND